LCAFLNFLATQYNLVSVLLAVDVQKKALVRVGGQVGNVADLRQCRGNVLGGLDTAELDEALSRLEEGVRDDLGGEGLTLGADDSCLLFLLGLDIKNKITILAPKIIFFFFTFSTT